MKFSRQEYIKENIKLSLINTNIILHSIDKNLNTVLKATEKIQSSNNKYEIMSHLSKIKDISLESIVEKCNMLKASLDRYTIPYEDIVIPEHIKYTAIRNIHKELKGKPPIYKRFRDKITKNNMPPLLSPPVDVEDDGSEAW